MTDVFRRFQYLCLFTLCLILPGLLVVGCQKLDDDGPSRAAYPVRVAGPAPETPTEESTSLPAPVSGETIISESLKDGRTTGTISDANFSASGLQLAGGDGFIRYSIPTSPDGYVEFSASGFTPGEIHGGSEFKAVLLTMWSGSEGYSYENSSFIFELRKYGYIEGRPDASDCLIFKIKSNGVWDAGKFHVLSWNSGVTYRFRIEWGGGQARAYRDGTLVATGPYYGEFAPNSHQIQIGAQPLRQKESPYGLLISDVVVGAL